MTVRPIRNLKRKPNPDQVPEKEAAPPRFEPGFDSERFRDALKNNIGLMQDLIRIFGEESAAKLDQADAALNDEDPEELYQAAHALKGLIGNYQARPVYRLSEAFNNLAHDGNLKKAADSLPKLKEAIRSLDEALRTFGETLEG